MLDSALVTGRGFWRLCWPGQFSVIAFALSLAFLFSFSVSGLRAQGQDWDEGIPGIDSVIESENHEAVVRLLLIRESITLCEGNYLLSYMDELDFEPDLVWMSCAGTKSMDVGNLSVDLLEKFNVYCFSGSSEFHYKEHAFRLLELRKDTCGKTEQCWKGFCLRDFRQGLLPESDSTLLASVLDQFDPVEGADLFEGSDIGKLSPYFKIAANSVKLKEDGSLIFLTTGPLRVCKMDTSLSMEEAICFEWVDDWLEWISSQTLGAVEDVSRFDQSQWKLIAEQLSVDLGTPAAASLVMGEAGSAKKIVVAFLRRFPYQNADGKWSLPLQAFIYQFDYDLNLINHWSYYDPARIPNSQVCAILGDEFYLSFYDRLQKKSGIISWSLLSDHLSVNVGSKRWDFRDRFGLLKESEGELLVGLWDEGYYEIKGQIRRGYVAWQGLNHILLRKDLEGVLRPSYMLLGTDCIEDSCLFLEYVAGDYCFSVNTPGSDPRALFCIPDDRECSLLQYNQGDINRICERDGRLKYERIEQAKIMALWREYSDY